MTEAPRPGSPSPADGPTTEHLEERWREVIDTLHESPRDVDLLVKAGQLSEQLQRPLEAYTYFKKALSLDPSKAFLVAKLRVLAATPQQKDEVTKISRQPTSFSSSLSDIFKYPVKGKGLAVLILGAIFLWIARALAAHGLGTSGMIIAVLAAAYLTMFYIDVCHTTVGGDDELPDWPDPLRINEFFIDVLKFACATLSAFLPLILLLIFFIGTLVASFGPPDEDFRPVRLPPGPAVPRPLAEAEDEDLAPSSPAAAPTPAAPAPPPRSSPFSATLVLILLGMGAFGIVGLIYLPMAKLSNVVLGSPWTCFNYPFVVHSILATRKDYLICLALYFGITILVGVAEVVVSLADVLIVTGVGLAFIELYGMTVLMRLLGLFYRMNQAKLGWMAD